MGNTIVVRLSEQQVKWLLAAVIQEEQSKSEILRQALNSYLIEKLNPNEKTIITYDQPRKTE